MYNIRGKLELFPSHEVWCLDGFVHPVFTNYHKVPCQVYKFGQVNSTIELSAKYCKVQSVLFLMADKANPNCVSSKTCSSEKTSSLSIKYSLPYKYAMHRRYCSKKKISLPIPGQRQRICIPDHSSSEQILPYVGLNILEIDSSYIKIKG